MTQTLTTERQQFAEQNEMSMDFVNWFFDEKKESFGNMWFLMAAAMWEAWKGRANREAQPVGFRYRHRDTASWLYNDWRWPDSVEAEQCQIEWLYTAPTAPAVPDELSRSLGSIAREYQTTQQNALFIVVGWNAYRAAMLAQPVSSSYKLVPIVPTQEMRDAWFFMEDFDTEWKALLAAAPEGGNG